MKDQRNTMQLLKNGTLIDGSGEPGKKIDILIDGEFIKEIGYFSNINAETIDCSNLYITPGIVDVHSHADMESIEHRTEKIKQGVTTEVVGNCGFSLFPTKETFQKSVPQSELFNIQSGKKWEDADSYFTELLSAKSYSNVAALTGHGTLRAFIKGAESSKFNKMESNSIERVLSNCIEQGSIGMSTGLNEVPGAFADLEELIFLSRIVKKYGGLYTSHLRDYKFRFLEAVEEALEIGRRTGIAVQLSHLQAVGQKNWHMMDSVLETINNALDEGIDVGIDAYPYLAGSCGLTQSLPTWALEGGIDELISRLKIPSTRLQIAEETEAGMSNTWEDIMVVNILKEKIYIGKNIQDISAIKGQDAIETALDLLLDNDGSVHIVSFNQSEENLKKVLTHPLTSIITDGLHHSGIPHPRTFSTYPTLYGEFVRDKNWMTLENAVHKTTYLPAKRFNLKKRGLVRADFYADLFVFSADEIGTEATYLNPDTPSKGIYHVMVNGQWELFDGNLTGVLSGSVLKN